MKKTFFVTLFVATQIGFAVLQVYKHSHIVDLTYRKQSHERTKQELAQKEERLKQQLCEIKNPSKIAHSVRQRGMENIQLSQIRKIAT